MMFEFPFTLNHPGDLLQLECRRADVAYIVNRANGGNRPKTNDD